ncbi:MAG TPA: hypothetical protein VG293_05870 [Solirubrobacteraceae bacterium]|nr:hypothetical protein [Solirubrobacteraceae bacterium]
MARLAGVSNLLGPLLGGLLTMALGWRADWWGLVPFTLLAAAGSFACYRRSFTAMQPEDGTRC